MDQTLSVLGLQRVQRSQEVVQIGVVLLVPFGRVGSTLQGHELAPAIHDTPEHKRARIHSQDGVGSRLAALDHFAIGGFLRMDARMGAGPKRGFIVERVEAGAALLRPAQLAHQQVDELVFIDFSVGEIGREAERSRLLGIGAHPARAGRLLILGH